MIRLLHGDCRQLLSTLDAESAQCVVTSPPYYGLRDYGTGSWEGGDADCDHGAAYVERRQSARQPSIDGGIPGSLRDKPITSCRCGAVRADKQIGLEPTPEVYVAELVAVFREVRRVLRADGTLWLNLGDSFAANGVPGLNTTTSSATFHGGNKDGHARLKKTVPAGLKPKDLIGIPWRVAFALQADGWYLRSDIIWHKPNPMPESVRDRPTKSHEYVFLLTKSRRYYYDAEAIAESSLGIRRPNFDGVRGALPKGSYQGVDRCGGGETRNARTVWTIASSPFSEAHFACMPPELAERCIKAGSKPGDTVLDPFAGAGTSLLVADRLQRHGLGIELNPAYGEMSQARIIGDAPLFAEVAVA